MICLGGVISTISEIIELLDREDSSSLKICLIFLPKLMSNIFIVEKVLDFCFISPTSKKKIIRVCYNKPHLILWTVSEP